MDSPLPEVTLKGNSGDQSTASCLSSVKKKGKGVDGAAGLFDLIGVSVSFAKLLGELRAGALSADGDAQKGDPTSFLANHASAINEDGNSSTAGSVLKKSFMLASAKEHAAIESQFTAGEESAGKEKSLQRTSNGEVSSALAEEKIATRMSGTNQSLQEEMKVAEASAVTSAKTTDGKERTSIGLMLDPENTASTKETAEKIAQGEKTHAVSAKPKDTVAAGLPAVSRDDGAEAVNLKAKTMTETTGNPALHDLEVQNPQGDRLSKDLDIKGLSIGKPSQDPKGRETQQAKDAASFSSVIGKDGGVSSSQILAEAERAQAYGNIFRQGMRKEQTEGRAIENLPGRTETSPISQQSGFSAVSVSSTNSGINAADTTTATPSFQEVASQVIDGASNMLNNGASRIVITLEPPNLGTLNMDVRVQHDTVRMLLVADNNEVKQVLNANLDQLKTALNGHGLSVDRLDVLVNERSYEGSRGFQPGGGALFDGGGRSRDEATDNRPQGDILRPAGIEFGEAPAGVISLFA